MTVTTPSERSERRQERQTPTDKTDGPSPTILSAPPAAIVPADAPTTLTATEELLLDTGFHPTTAHAFRDFDMEAVRGELHRHDLLAWRPQEERDRRIGRLVLRWRKVRPEVLREREVGGSYQEPAVSIAVSRRTHLVPVQNDVPQQEESVCEEEPLDPWMERAQRLRPQWTDEQQATLARVLRHAPNDGAAVIMAQVMLGMARRC